MSEDARVKRLPIHLGVYWHGVARHTDDGVRMRSAFGPYVELLAESVDRLTLVAHDPPETAEHGEQFDDYLARPSRGNIEVLSLGPLGGRGDYLTRMRRVARTIGPASEAWDVLLLRFGRRANLVYRANRCPRIVTLVWGTSMPEGIRSLLASKSPLAIALGLRREWHLRRILRGSGLAFTDGEACQERYAAFVPRSQMGLLRSSSRRARYTYLARDRLDRSDARFIVVGHVTAVKGVFDAIETFSMVREQLLPEATLHVVGMGHALDEARRRVDASAHAEAITFHGWVPAGEELFSLYRDSDVLLFMSRSSSESLPRVISEAWAHSVIVVATPVGSLPLAFRHEHEVEFVPIGDVHAAFEAVRELSERPDLRSRLLEAGYARAMEATLEHVTAELVGAVQERWPKLDQPSAGDRG